MKAQLNGIVFPGSKDRVENHVIPCVSKYLYQFIVPEWKNTMLKIFEGKIIANIFSCVGVYVGMKSATNEKLKLNILYAVNEKIHLEIFTCTQQKNVV